MLTSFYRTVQRLFGSPARALLSPRVIRRTGPAAGENCPYFWDDRVKLALPGLFIMLERKTMSPIPIEVHVVVPRVEMRFRKGGKEYQQEIELIFNSITVVSSPQHPPLGQGKAN